MSETPQDQVREQAAERGRRQQLWWYFVIFGCLLLLSIYSGGLFLYAAAVVSFVYVTALAVAVAGHRDLAVWRQLSASEVELGAVVSSRVMVQNRKAWPAPWLFYEDRVDDGVDIEGARGGCRTLAAGAKEHLSYQLHTFRRGLFRVGPTVLETTDPFGLVRRFRVDDAASFLTVLPRPVEMGQGWPLGHQPIHQVPRRRSLLEDPSRFRGVRDYQRGDSLKQVHWRATAKTRRVQVKVFEPAVLDGALLAVEMCAAWYGGAVASAGGIDPKEELAITTAVSIGHFVLGGDQAVGLIANGADAAERYPADWTGESFRRFEDMVEHTESRRKITRVRPVELPAAKGARQWKRLQTLLARLVPSDGVTLPELLTSELPRLPRSLVVMVVTPRVDGSLAACLGSLRRSGIEAAVLWIAGSGREKAAVLPSSVPLYRIDRASDLESLGHQRL